MATTEGSLGTPATRLEAELDAASKPVDGRSLTALKLREKRLRKAANLRARGAGWEEVAEVIGYRSKRRDMIARRFCTQDRHLWAKLMREASDDYLADEIEPEAVRTQRQLMGLKDSTEVKEKDVAVRSADSILRYLASIRRKEIAVGVLAVQGSDEELIERLRASANAAAQQAAREAEIVKPAALIGDGTNGTGSPGKPEVAGD